MGSSSQQFCLKWNNHHSNMLNVFEHLLSSEALVDVTLACEGHSLKAHKMVLSACSPFFQSLFLENPCKHPIVILKDMRYADLKAIIDFMYRGEVNVSQNQLSALLKTAETLKVKGLAEVSGEDGQSNGSGVVQQEVVQQTVPQATAPPTGGSATQGGGGGGTTTPSSGARAETPPLSRRKRGRPRRRSLSDSNRSDSEDQVPAKIREAESPEVIEDRDMDTSSSTAGAAEGPNGVQKLPLPLQTQTQTQSQESRLAIDEATSGDEGDFLPSKLMEQSMTTENVPVFPESQGTGSTRSPTPSQRLMIGSSSLVERSMQGPSTSDSQALVPVSQSSEVSGTGGHSSQDIPEDIKPTGLVSYDEPSLSPVAGPSHHSQDGSAMMMYMDSSGVPAIPGPSNYQPDKQSSSQTQPSQEYYIHVPRIRRSTLVSNMNDTDYQMVTGSRGKKLLSYKGYLFYNYRVNATTNTSHWRCAKYRYKCYARVVLLNDVIISCVREHSHPIGNTRSVADQSSYEFDFNDQGEGIITPDIH